MKPSEFPIDPRFRTPGPAFIENGMAHLRSHHDVRRAMLDRAEKWFSPDVSYWAPPHQRIHITWSFVWAAGKQRADGTQGRHDTLRGILEPYFRLRAVKTLTPQLRDHARALLTEVIEKGTGEVNLAADFAYRLSLRTICSLLSVPIEREQWLYDQLQADTKALAVDPTQREPEEVEAYLWELVHDRERRPQDTLLDLLIAAWRQKTIDDLELLGHIWGMFESGVDDAGTNVINAFGLLAEFGFLDEARARVNDDDDWVHRAGEEILRFGSPFAAVPSVTVKDVVLDGGLTIPAATPVSLWLSAANRDDAINGGNPDANSPEVFDPNRWPNDHLAVGVGAHRCLGAQLARIEARIALESAFQYLPGLEFDAGRPFERYVGMTHGVTEAYFRFDRHAAERHLALLRASQAR